LVRVSTADQQPHLQVDALKRAGCFRVFTETASGARSDRPALSSSWTSSAPVTLWWFGSWTALGRSLGHLVDTVTGLAERGIGFRSLQEAIDTTTPGGKLVFHVFAALAEFERDLIRERTSTGLAAARARGLHVADLQRRLPQRRNSPTWPFGYHLRRSWRKRGSSPGNEPAAWRI
jgi:DNA invertase Pin-like site-specific DNA recombinase